MNIRGKQAIPLLVAVLMILAGGNVHAVELWSLDLWNDNVQSSGGPSGGQTGGQTGGQNAGQTNGPSGGQGGKPPSPQGSPSGWPPAVPTTELWSESLFQDLYGSPQDGGNAPVAPGTPAPTIPPDSGRTEAPQDRQPAGGQPDASPNPRQGGGNDRQPAQSGGDQTVLVTMQIGNKQAVVRGVTRDISVPPYTINGRTMVPLRFTGEALGAKVSWNADEQKVTLELGGKTIDLWVGNTTALVDGTLVEIDFPPVVMNGTTLVPLRFVSEQFGFNVTYDTGTKTITIYGNPDSGETGSQADEDGRETGEPDNAAGGRPPEEAPGNRTPDPPNGTPSEQPDSSQEDGDANGEEPSEPEQPVKTPEQWSRELGFDYIGVWRLFIDDIQQAGISMGYMAIYPDGTYLLHHDVHGEATGIWRPGEKNEVLGQDRLLILENGPRGIDWAVIPRRTGAAVSVRYQQGYMGGNKLWFADSVAAKVNLDQGE
jgi:hypothetical protein